MTAWTRPELYTWRMDDNAELAAEVWGSPTDPPVLLAHAGGALGDILSTLAEALGDEGFYALALDLRGRADIAAHAAGDIITVSLALPKVPVAIAGGIAAHAAIEATARQPHHRQILFRHLILLQSAGCQTTLTIPVTLANPQSGTLHAEVLRCLQGLPG